MNAIDRQKITDRLNQATEGAPKKPEAFDLSELTTTRMEGVPQQIAERARNSKGELQSDIAKTRQQAAQESIPLTPEDEKKLQSVDQRAAEAEYELLKKLDAAKRRFEDTKAAFDKVNGVFSGLTAKRREDRSAAEMAMLDAQYEYQREIAKIQDSNVGRKALNLHITREQLAGVEADGKKSGLVSALFGEKSQKVVPGNSETFGTGEYAQYMKEQYEKSRAEILGGSLGNLLAEQVQLVDTRALEMQKRDFELYGLQKSLSKANLAELLHWQPTSRIGKIVGNGMSARTAVNLALVGAGVAMAATGSGVVVGAATGGLYLTRRLLGGSASAVGAYDALRGWKSGSVEKVIAAKSLRELSDEELLDASGQLESQAIINGVRVSDNVTYKKILAERAVRSAKKMESRTGAKAESIRSALQALSKETDAAFDKMYKQESQADAKLRAISVGIGVLVGSGVVSEVVKGAVRGVETVAQVTGVSEFAGRTVRSAVDSIISEARAEDLYSHQDPAELIDAAMTNEEKIARWKALIQANGHDTPQGREMLSADGRISFLLDRQGYVSYRTVDSSSGSFQHEPVPAPVEPEISVAEKIAALKKQIQLEGDQAPAGRVLTSPDGKVAFVLREDGTVNYHTIEENGSLNAEPHPLESTEDWEVVTQTKEAAPVPSELPHQPLGEELPTENEAVEVVADPVELSDSTYLMHFTDASATTAVRAEGLQKLIEHLGRTSGTERLLTMNDWNVQFYTSPDGHLSYVMKGLDGKIISMRIPLESDADWKAMTEHMRMDAAPIQEQRYATGLFVAEAEKIARLETQQHFPTPGEILRGAAKGIRMADDGLNRGFDTAANRLANIGEGGADAHAGDPDYAAYQALRQKEAMERFGVTPEQLEYVQSRVEVQHRDTLPDPGHAAEFRDHKQALEIARDQAALKAAQEQREALQVHNDINPAATEAARQALESGRISLPNGVEVRFYGHGKAIDIVFNPITSKDQAVSELMRGGEYRYIIAQNQAANGYDRADEEIAFVEKHAQALSSCLHLRDFMMQNGLTDTKEYAKLQEVILTEKAAVGKFGHVLADDPHYGKPSTHQVVGKFVSVHSGLYDPNAPQHQFEQTQVYREILARKEAELEAAAKQQGGSEQ